MLAFGVDVEKVGIREYGFFVRDEHSFMNRADIETKAGTEESSLSVNLAACFAKDCICGNRNDVEGTMRDRDDC
jgi:hypothetical protein